MVLLNSYDGLITGTGISDLLDSVQSSDLTSQQFVILGFIGGVGSGKSTLAKWLSRQFEIPVVDGDRLGHAALEQSEVKKQLVERFGAEILNPSGEIDRSRLGKLVWGNNAQAVRARKELEQIVHPVIRKSIENAIVEARQSGNIAVIIDAAVMIEADWHQACDKLIFVDTPDAKRLEHVINSRNWTEQQLVEREQSQLDLDVKRKHADLVIDNSGTIEQSGQQLMQWLHQQFGWPFK